MQLKEEYYNYRWAFLIGLSIPIWIVGRLYIIAAFSGRELDFRSSGDSPFSMILDVLVFYAVGILVSLFFCFLYAKTAKKSTAQRRFLTIGFILALWFAASVTLTAGLLNSSILLIGLGGAIAGCIILSIFYLIYYLTTLFTKTKNN